MTARAIVAGALVKAPVSKTSKAGKSYVLATIREGKGDAARWWKAFIFGGSAMAEVLRLGDGDPLAVSGEFDCQPYRTDAGEERQNWSIMVDAVLSARKAKREDGPHG
jgi:hypothetical protein